MKISSSDIKILQPWSTFVMKLKMPDSLVELGLKMTDEALVEKNKPYGKSLAGQLEEEWGLEYKLTLDKFSDLKYYLDEASIKYAALANMQTNPDEVNPIPLNAVINKIWSVHQYDGDYNPIHIHTAQISATFYLKIPKYLPSKKQHQEHSNDDGSIVFINNSANNNGMGGLVRWGNVGSLKISPEVGDLYLFPSSMYHAVYPFRTKTGKEERRSVSFNVFVS